LSLLCLVPPDSLLHAFLLETHSLLSRFPALLALVEADLDADALRKKALRLQDAQWIDNHTLPLPTIVTPPPSAPAPLSLQQGRPRTPAYVVFFALLLRGFLSAGFKARPVASQLQESISLHVFFANLSLKLPGASTLTDLCNAVTNETRLRILDAQIAAALELELDDFTIMLQDSTHVGGHTEWPTESRLMVALCGRLLRVGGKLDRLDLPRVGSPVARELLGEMVTLDREIDMDRNRKNSARRRRRNYEQLLKKGKRVHKILAEQVAPLAALLAALDRLPSRKLRAARVVAHLHEDLDALTKVFSTCEARVLRGEKVKMAEKVLSLSDPDAAFIAKGQREPVVGYKPQLARSGSGLITGLLLPKGNASDSHQLVPMFNAVYERTHVVPEVVSVDDGYSSAENVRALKARMRELLAEQAQGAKVNGEELHDEKFILSLSGSKGRALTAAADWDSDDYEQARDLRSAVESLMFTLKQGFHFGEVARRGLSAAYADLLEKALAYNTCRTIRLRQVRAAEVEAESQSALAA
jgi:hypothetical protein